MSRPGIQLSCDESPGKEEDDPSLRLALQRIVRAFLVAKVLSSSGTQRIWERVCLRSLGNWNEADPFLHGPKRDPKSLSISDGRVQKGRSYTTSNRSSRIR